MNAIAVHFLIETKASLRKKQQMFLSYLFPLGFFLMMGAVMPQLNPLFLNDMIPAMIMFAVMASSLLGLPDTFVTSRESGVFRGYRINGVKPAPLIFIPSVISMIHMLVVSFIILALSPALFNAPSPDKTFRLILIILLSCFCFSGISTLIGIISSNSRVSVMLSQIIFIPSMIIGGLMIPYEMLPVNVKTAVLFIPSTHCMNLFKAWAFGSETNLSISVSTATLTAAGMISYLLAAFFFRWNSGQNSQNAKVVRALKP